MLRHALVRMFSLFLILFLVSLAYAGHKFPDYPVQAAADYSNKVEKANLVVAVEPVDDLDQQKTYFNSRLGSKGILPVFLVIQNSSSTDTYLFDSSALGLADAVDISGPGTRRIGARLGSGGLIDLTLVTEVTEVRENMMKKQVRSKTLSPGSSVHGFIYVPMPTDTARKKTHLQVALTNAQSGETEVLNLFF